MPAGAVVSAVPSSSDDELSLSQATVRVRFSRMKAARGSLGISRARICIVEVSVRAGAPGGSGGIVRETI